VTAPEEVIFGSRATGTAAFEALRCRGTTVWPANHHADIPTIAHQGAHIHPQTEK
jgi:hypothetical protein